ncbi:uncharacterized protein LOC112687357 isoform X2 [Sipha flava]|uniref:Uncharacterized protein LOC112687357 isoform X2 n=1 Tax=Sipha flava TaxID=143950 RepID=A0A8B8FXT4_9HEMI|nr:uncharacterized protein LOC112687357 isoform X2 [Sipha flava]
MINEDIQYEVQVTNAYKNYGANNVFNGLNMNVTSGSIYGLLGPSGCGKSTLLHCILGTMTLDSGTIDLKVESLKDVGYMPQDLCLETELTINETFEYYGTLYKMNEKSIKTKKVELTTFLQLSNTDSYIKDLSGGQSRRVSLAISLLHDPKLIILDEPTVGIDPILRNDIWTEFTKMVVQHKKTIIITTHYIEEANQANCIGLMRNGVIIEEKSPQDILTKCNTDSLESAFLELCCNQDKNENHMAKNVPAKEVPRKNKLKKIENNIDFHRIKALFKKNWQVFSRDYITQRCIFDESFNEAMSCVVLDYFASQNYKLIEVKDQEAGEMSMNNAGNMAFIYFQRNYTKDLIKYINRDDNITEYSIFMHITNENFLFKNQIRMDVYKSYNHLMKTVLNNCNINPRTINLPVDVHTIVGNDVKIYTNGIIALFIEMTIFFLLSSFGASIVLTEKISGILNRSMFAGVNLMEFSTALFCLCTLILSVQSVLFCLISYVLFFNPIITSGLFLYSFGLLLSGWIGFLFGK